MLHEVLRDIDRHHPALLTDRLRQQSGEQSRPAADISHHHARFDSAEVDDLLPLVVHLAAFSFKPLDKVRC